MIREHLIPCGLCRTLQLPEALVDVSDFAPLLKRVCEGVCEDEVVAEYHDDDACECAPCCRSRKRADAVRLAEESRVRGGISANGFELLGWVEE